MEAPNEARAILRRVGWVLIVSEMLNLGWALVEFLSGGSHSLSLDLTFLVGGILLVNGNLTAARWVAWFCAFFVSAVIAFAVSWPIIVPFDLVALWFRLHRWAWIQALATIGLMTAIVFWAFVQLLSRPVVDAQRSAGQKPLRAWTGVASGVALVVLLVGVIHAMFSGETGQKALRLAREQKGPKYRYAMKSIQIHNSEVTATVVAYDDHSYEDVEVSWAD